MNAAEVATTKSNAKTVTSKQLKTSNMKKYHISWLIGKDEQGLDLSTGITVEAESMLEALAAWSMAHPEIVEPLYIAVK